MSLSPISRWNPRLVIEVTTTVSTASRPRRWRSIASTARITSPFTGRPRPSTTRQRSASPSNAIPRSRPWSATSAGLAADPVDALAQQLEQRRPTAPGGAVGAVDADREPGLHAVAVRRRQPGDVVPARVRQLLRMAPALARLVVHQPLDLGLVLVGELAAVTAQELDAVVLERVVRRRDHAAQRGAGLARQHGNARGRDHARADGDRPRGHHALDQRRFQRHTRLAGVAPDQDRATRSRKPPRRGTQVTRQRLGQVDARLAADTVRAEQLAHVRQTRRRLALRELWPLARLLQARLLALDLARVPRQETRLLQLWTQRLVGLDQRTRDPVAERSGLAGDAAAHDPSAHVEAGLGAAHPQRGHGHRLQRRPREVLGQSLAVDDDLTGTRHQHHAGDRGLPLAGGAVYDCGCDHYELSFNGAGFWAAWGCSGPA